MVGQLSTSFAAPGNDHSINVIYGAEGSLTLTGGQRSLRGEHVLELIKYVNPPPRERPTSERSVIGGSHLAFAVDDIQAAYKKLSAAGAKTLNAPVAVAPGRTVCYLQDPDGNWLELMELTE